MTDELSEYLASLERDDAYRVDCVLKRSDVETTERVFARSGDQHEHGPYIRKFIARESGLGDIYERIYRVNKEGRRFAHIPYVLDYQRTDQAIVVVMEHVNGQTLADVVYEHGPGVALAAEVFPAVCDAVSELHESFDPPIIHRDLKPSNIMLKNGVPVIIDFGIAREFHDAADTDTTTLGTRAYAPPEQFGYEQTTVRSDVYTLGLLLYYLLVEQTPSPKVIRRGFADNRIPEALRRVIAYATAFDPKERYESAAELKAAFLRAMAECAPVTAVKTPQVKAPNPPAAPIGDPEIAIGPDAQATIHWSGEVPLQEGARPTPVNVEIHVSAADAVMGARSAGAPQARRQGANPATDAVPPARDPGKGRVRNWAIVAFLVLLVLYSWWDAIHPENVTHAYSAPYHQVLYFICVPAVMAVFAYAGLDKEGLRARYPQVAWPTGSGTAILGILVFAVALAISLAARAIAGI